MTLIDQLRRSSCTTDGNSITSLWSGFNLETTPLLHHRASPYIMELLANLVDLY